MEISLVFHDNPGLVRNFGHTVLLAELSRAAAGGVTTWLIHAWDTTTNCRREDG